MSGDTGTQRPPLFTDTLQIGIVVRDLYSTIDTYIHDYGLGPWEIYEMNPSTVTEMEKDEAPAPHAMRLALTMVGSVQWELIEPIGDGSIYAEFLREHGEGLHHVGVAVESYAETVDELHRKGHILLQAGNLQGARYAYPSTDRDLKVLTEIFDFPPDLTLTPDSVYPT
jgi:methylmalonyl-CoA/ethylmalonyl-CoA epimerase